jgi:LPXTG-motif cell wall-anchored protein
VGGGGSFSTTVTIPSSVEAGPHTIVCSGTDVEGLSVTSDSDIDVLGAVVPGGTAFTGSSSDVPLLAGLGVLLALIGIAALIVGTRRRRKATVPSP